MFAGCTRREQKVQTCTRGAGLPRRTCRLERRLRPLQEGSRRRYLGIPAVHAIGPTANEVGNRADAEALSRLGHLCPPAHRADTGQGDVIPMVDGQRELWDCKVVGWWS